MHCALKPSGPQHEDSGTLFPAASLADQLHTLLMDLNLPLGSSSYNMPEYQGTARFSACHPVTVLRWQQQNPGVFQALLTSQAA